MSDQSEQWSEASAAQSARLADLYRQHADWLGRRFRSRWGDEADDIVQDAWLRLSRYEVLAIRSPRALLARIARNLAHDRARQAIRAGRLADGAPPGSTSGGQYETAVLKQVVTSMPGPLRDVFLLSRFAALSHRDIAAKLGISEKTVEWRLAKALTHCVRELENDGEL